MKLFHQDDTYYFFDNDVVFGIDTKDSFCIYHSMNMDGNEIKTVPPQILSTLFWLIFEGKEDRKFTHIYNALLDLLGINGN